MPAYTTRMPAGIAGNISRSDSVTVEPVQINSAKPPLAYGVFGKFVSNRAEPLEAADAAAVVVGMFTRPYPFQSTDNNFGGGVPPTSGILDFLRRGYVSVILKSGTATKGAPVFVVTTAGGTSNLNDIVTSAAPASGGTAVQVANCFFTGAADANGITEVAYNI